jgi:hypothetical protein
MLISNSRIKKFVFLMEKKLFNQFSFVIVAESHYDEYHLEGHN